MPHIEVVSNWPSSYTKVGTTEKVPSEIAYLEDGTTEWGSNIGEKTKRHMWTKLELEESQNREVAKHAKNLARTGQKGSKKPVDIVSDFLAHIRGHLLQVLDNRYGRDLWTTLPIVLVVTVPAVWSDAAKDRTKQAVYEAGFSKAYFPKLENTMMTAEPEAAAIFMIKELRGSIHEDKLKAGDGFTVVDMGGGTTDIASYKVIRINPLVLEEATVGNGDQCGGSFVERAFFKFLEHRLGIQRFIEMAGCRSEDVPRGLLTEGMIKLVQDFIHQVKSVFSGTEKRSLRLPWPLSLIEEDKAAGIRDGDLFMTP